MFEIAEIIFQVLENNEAWSWSGNFWIVHVLGLSIRPSMSQSVQFVQNRQISINFWIVHVLGLSIRPSMSQSIQFVQNRQISMIDKPRTCTIQKLTESKYWDLLKHVWNCWNNIPGPWKQWSLIMIWYNFPQ
jgi:hypothetical protein